MKTLIAIFIAFTSVVSSAEAGRFTGGGFKPVKQEVVWDSTTEFSIQCKAPGWFKKNTYDIEVYAADYADSTSSQTITVFLNNKEVGRQYNSEWSIVSINGEDYINPIHLSLNSELEIHIRYETRKHLFGNSGWMTAAVDHKWSSTKGHYEDTVFEEFCKEL